MARWCAPNPGPTSCHAAIRAVVPTSGSRRCALPRRGRTSGVKRRISSAVGPTVCFGSPPAVEDADACQSNRQGHRRHVGSALNRAHPSVQRPPAEKCRPEAVRPRALPLRRAKECHHLGRVHDSHPKDSGPASSLLSSRSIHPIMPCFGFTTLLGTIGRLARASPPLPGDVAPPQ